MAEIKEALCILEEFLKVNSFTNYTIKPQMGYVIVAPRVGLIPQIFVGRYYTLWSRSRVHEVDNALPAQGMVSIFTNYDHTDYDYNQYFGFGYSVTLESLAEMARYVSLVSQLSQPQVIQFYSEGGYNPWGAPP